MSAEMWQACLLRNMALSSKVIQVLHLTRCHMLLTMFVPMYFEMQASLSLHPVR